jgi:hypothetical protein
VACTSKRTTQREKIVNHHVQVVIHAVSVLDSECAEWSAGA